MRKAFVGLFLALIALSCRAQDTLPPLPSWDNAAQAAWWTRNPTPQSWPQAVSDLKAQLQANYKQNGTSVYANPDFQGWLEHLEWIQLGVAYPEVIADPNDLKAFIDLGKDPVVSHLFVEKLDPADVKKVALQNLIKLQQANAADLHEYAALGVAFCLVFDRPFPRNWPHSQVPQSAVPIGDVDVVQRFNFYVQSNRDHKLDLDPTQLTFEKLKYLVDSEVSLSELEYAQKDRISFSHFEDAFFAITYNQTRTSTGNIAFMWDQPTYTLDDIKKNGGICVDQAYYATILGKGRGIPTIFFHGQGSGGGHAWFGYLSSSGKWELDCGRYESQNYPKGYAVDPQTWQPIDDTILTNFFKNGDANPNFHPAETAIAWAQQQDQPASIKQVLDEARAVMPELSKTWLIESRFLDYTHASDEDKKAFYESWINQFNSFADMKVNGQQRLLAVLKKMNDPAADGLQQDIVLANRSGNIDLGIQGAWDTINGKIQSGDWDGARLEYEKSIRDFGEQGGGTLFYDLVSPYIEAVVKAGRIDEANREIKFTEERMNIEGGSIISGEFDELKGKVGDMKRAASQ
jgi:hypothetical protein